MQQDKPELQVLIEQVGSLRDLVKDITSATNWLLQQYKEHPTWRLQRHPTQPEPPPVLVAARERMRLALERFSALEDEVEWPERWGLKWAWTEICRLANPKERTPLERDFGQAFKVIDLIEWRLRLEHFLELNLPQHVAADTIASQLDGLSLLLGYFRALSELGPMYDDQFDAVREDRIRCLRQLVARLAPVVKGWEDQRFPVHVAQLYDFGINPTGGHDVVIEALRACAEMSLAAPAPPAPLRSPVGVDANGNIVAEGGVEGHPPPMPDASPAIPSRGPMLKGVRDQKRGMMMDFLQRDPTLREDPMALARMIGTSRKTVVRWLRGGQT